jgi:hypothetical protein
LGTPFPKLRFESTRIRHINEGGQERNLESKIEDAKYKDGKVSFKVNREFNGAKVVITNEGTIKGDIFNVGWANPRPRLEQTTKHTTASLPLIASPH